MKKGLKHYDSRGNKVCEEDYVISNDVVGIVIKIKPKWNRLVIRWLDGSTGSKWVGHVYKVEPEDLI